MLAAEGVTRFRAEHRDGPLGVSDRRGIGSLLAWRSILFELDLVGQDPARYQGAGYGNLSVRIGAPSAPRARRPFVVTGTQTGGREVLAERDLAVVEAYDLRANTVRSRGPARPSSESMTHGAIYDLSPRIRYVVHVHAPLLWTSAAALRLPTTDKHVGYGTPEMAREVFRLYRDTHLPDLGVLAMGGHEDGIIAFAHDCDEACANLLAMLASARARALPRRAAT